MYFLVPLLWCITAFYVSAFTVVGLLWTIIRLRDVAMPPTPTPAPSRRIIQPAPLVGSAQREGRALQDAGRVRTTSPECGYGSAPVDLWLKELHPGLQELATGATRIATTQGRRVRDTLDQLIESGAEITKVQSHYDNLHLLCGNRELRLSYPRSSASAVHLEDVLNEALIGESLQLTEYFKGDRGRWHLTVSGADATYTLKADMVSCHHSK